MQESIETISEMAATARRDFERYSARVSCLLGFVPDDRLTWSPSPTAKSSLRIAAHCALTSRFFADIITGALPAITPEEFFKALSADEARITTRESALALLEETTVSLCRAIDTVNADNLDAPRGSPFGPLPLRFWIVQGREQMAGHAGQMEYLQTVWGDLDNHY
jgi:hypothetical protein